MTNLHEHSRQQAFARVYRPQTFDEVVGQQHVLDALRYSLDHQNLHHAYLLTGTRGVGKTTLGRLFAKALNCEQGISSHPCGKCSACESIAAGRFVDLIEVDGASNTKVEDTRELLEDVQFVPTQGRFKIYLIDEVHMLSTHSFNALLKTLEEPPEHVKFILATTDPQKLPITVLSRCLQFHLQLMPVPLIQQHLASVLEREKIPYEDRALYLLAEAAQGSMRDALTLADQARSQGQGQIQTAAVTSMLGILDQHLAHQLFKSVLTDSPKAILTLFQQVESTGADSDQILKDLIELCHQVALTQALGEQDAQALFIDPWLCQSLLELANASSPTHVQLCFEVLLSARKSLPYASTPALAVRMALLRMACFQSFQTSELQFNQDAHDDQSGQHQHNAQPAAEKKKPLASTSTLSSDQRLDQQTNDQTKAAPESQAVMQPVSLPASQSAKPPIYEAAGEWSSDTQKTDQSDVSTASLPENDSGQTLQLNKENPRKAQQNFNQSNELDQTIASLTDAHQWYRFLKKHSPGGLYGQLLANSRITEVQQNDQTWDLHLVVSDSVFSYDANDTPKQLTQILHKAFRCTVRVTSEQVHSIADSPATLRIAETSAQREAFAERVQQMPFITRLQQLMEVSVQIAE